MTIYIVLSSYSDIYHNSHVDILGVFDDEDKAETCKRKWKSTYGDVEIREEELN